MLTGFKTFDLFGNLSSRLNRSRCNSHHFFKIDGLCLKQLPPRVYHFIIGIVLSSTLLILIPNAGNAESIQYTGTSLVGYVIIAFFFALGIWLGIWMSPIGG